jgi:LmbE family N-acetylglucosaminyl deacetylase
MNREIDILVIIAHPDDAEFSAAGTIARWIREGKTAAYVVCTSGEKGTNDPNMLPEMLAVLREDEQRAAAAILGVKEVVFLRLPDQGLEDTPEYRKQLVGMIRLFRPKTVVTSDPYHRYIWHRDHRIVGQAVIDSIYPLARDHWAFPDLSEKGLLPHKVKEIFFFAAEDINFRSDITSTFHLKREALQCHKSQIQGIGDLDTWLRQRSREAAGGEAFEFAEAFHRVEIHI